MGMSHKRVIAATAAVGIAIVAFWFSVGGSGGSSRAGVAAGEAKAQAPLEVTMADRERAQQDAIACIEGARLQVVERTPSDGLRLSTYSTIASDPGLGHEITSKCRAQYSDPVERAWQEQRRAPGSADVDAMQQRLSACVAAGGVPEVADQAGAEAFVAYADPALEPLNIAKNDFRLYQQCAYQEETQTGMLAPYPWPGFEKLDWLGEVGQ